MGLKDQVEFEQFEQDDVEVQTEATTVNTKEIDMTTTATNTASASVAATTAIAAAATGTAVAAHRPATKLVQAFTDKHAVFDIATVEGLGMAVPRMKGEQGSIFAGEDDLGAAIRLEIISINPRWTIGTGTDDKESKDFFRVSNDGHLIAGENITVDDYLNDLRAQGFDKAKKSEYLDIFGFVTWSEKKGDVPEEQRELACLQCSPTSKGAFVAFATTRGLLESRGVAKPLDVIEVHAEKRANGSNRYTNFSFKAPKA